MHRSHGPVYAPENILAAKQKYLAAGDKTRATETMEVWRKRGGPGRSGSGPSGYKMKPSRVLARVMAEIAARYKPKQKASKTAVADLDGNSK